MSEREQKLIDICFSIAITVKNYQRHFEVFTDEEMAEWTARELKNCGFPTTPVGSSWGKLQDE